jgi:hypothetical protein
MHTTRLLHESREISEGASVRTRGRGHGPAWGAVERKRTEERREPQTSGGL